MSMVVSTPESGVRTIYTIQRKSKQSKTILKITSLKNKLQKKNLEINELKKSLKMISEKNQELWLKLKKIKHSSNQLKKSKLKYQTQLKQELVQLNESKLLINQLQIENKIQLETELKASNLKMIEMKEQLQNEQEQLNQQFSEMIKKQYAQLLQQQQYIAEQKEQQLIQENCKLEEFKSKIFDKINCYINAHGANIITTEEAFVFIKSLVEPTFPINIVLSLDATQSISYMKKLFPNKKIINYYCLELQEELNQQFYMAEEFNFQDIDIREYQIKQFQELFQKFPNKVGGIFVIVKFERNDIMKKNFMEIFNYFNKFQQIINLVVTDFHLSESSKTDKIMLKTIFEKFKLKNIIFIDQNKSNLISDLKLSCSQQNNQQYYPFNTSNTIFEPISMEIQSKVLNELNKALNLH